MMIGHFYPNLVTATVVAGATTIVINVPATSAAIEIQNDLEWLTAGN